MAENMDTSADDEADGSDKDIIEDAIECLNSYLDRESDNIKRAQDAIRFRAGEQWPDTIKHERENPYQDGGSRPCPVLDKTNQYIRQIVNEERQNRAAIKIRPVDDYSDPKTAEIITGIIRHIEDQSEATIAYTSAGEQAIDGGFGYWRIITEYCDLDSFDDQDIRIKRIPNRFSVALGPHTEADGSDAKEGLIWEDMPRDQFESDYPDAKVADFTQQDGWTEKDSVRVAEYFYIETTSTKIHLTQNGSILSDEDYTALVAEGKKQGIEVPKPIKSRETVKKQVKWCKLTSEEILDQKDLPGTYIPIVKVTGNELVMPDGKIRLSGALELMMDPQRLHNFAHAGFIEHVALAPRAPWLADEEQVRDYEQDYAEANRKPIALLKYKSRAEDGHLLPAPQRTPPAGIAPGWQAMLQNTEHAIEASAGMYGPSVGARSQEKSGIALQEQKAQGAIGNFHYPDNLSRSIQHTGRILLQWIPIYYDTRRVVRILGEDGNHEMVKIDPSQPAAVNPELNEFNQEIGKIYNLGLGKYDVAVTTGPSYSAKRQEAAANLGNIMGTAPGLLNVIGDLYFKYSDFPGADAIAERMKATLIPAVQQMEQGKEKNLDPKAQAMMAQMQQAAQQIQMQGQQLAQKEQQLNSIAQQVGVDKQSVDMARREIEAAKKLLDAQVKEQQANLRLQALELQKDPEMEIEARIIMERMKEDAENTRFDREMRLKEMVAGVTPSPFEDRFGQVVQNIGQQIDTMLQESKKPRPIKIIRDANGDVVEVNGQPVQRDQQGNLIGVGNYEN